MILKKKTRFESVNKLWVYLKVIVVIDKSW